MYKKLLSILIVIYMCINCVVTVTYADTENLDISEYSNNIQFLTSIGAMTDVDYNYNRILNRAEYSELLVMIAGQGHLNTSVKKTEYDTSYLNDKGWLWIADKEQQSTSASSTRFSDVTNDMEEWNCIDYVTKTQLMNGYDNQFKPYQNIVGYDIVRSLVILLNLECVNGEVSNEKCISLASKYGLLKDLKEKDLSRPFRMYDVAKLIVNAMNTEPFVIKDLYASGATYAQIDGNYLMTVLFDIYTDKGIVTSTEYAALDGFEKVYEDHITVDGVEYESEIDPDYYLGRKIEVYYREDKDYDEKSIVYYVERNKDSVITIESEDVISFKNRTLSYELGNRTKSHVFDSDTVVIYNGSRLDSYNDSVLEFNNNGAQKTGNIVIMEDVNGQTLIKVTKFESMVVSSVDYYNEIIYGEGDISSLNLSNVDNKGIKFDDGTDVMFETIGKNNILSVARTLSGKQDERYQIIISNNIKTGKINTIDNEDNILKINNESFKFIENLVQLTGYNMSSDYNFYVNHLGYIVKIKPKADVNGQYGYLQKVVWDDFEDILYIRIFESNSEFKKYEIKDKKRFNGKTLKPEKLYLELTDGGVTKYQLIHYVIDDEDNIVEITTAAGKQGAFAKFDISAEGVDWLDYRNGALLNNTISTGFSLFINTDKFVYFSIPSDKENTEAYACANSLVNQQKYYFDEFYKSTADSSMVDVCIEMDAQIAQEFVSSSAEPYMMISEIRYCIDDNDELHYLIKGINMSEEVEYKCYDEDLFATCQQLNVGDIVRFNVNSMTKKVEYIKKFFDAKEKVMADGLTVHGDPLHPYEVFNGYAVNSTDNDQILEVHPYTYGDDGKIDYSGSNMAVSTYSSRYFKYPKKIICYNSSDRRGSVTVGNKSDVICSSNVNEASMLVLCSYYESAQVLFVIR